MRISCQFVELSLRSSKIVYRSDESAIIVIDGAVDSNAASIFTVFMQIFLFLSFSVSDSLFSLDTMISSFSVLDTRYFLV